MKSTEKYLKYLTYSSIILSLGICLYFLRVFFWDSRYWMPIVWSLLLTVPVILYLFYLKKSKLKTKGTTATFIYLMIFAHLAYYIYLYSQAVIPILKGLSLAATQQYYLFSLLYLIPIMLGLIGLTYYIIMYRKYPYKIFLSYATKDEYLAGVVNAYLTDKKKYLVVQDRINFELGAKLDEIIQEKISESDITLALLTKNSLASRWVIEEFEFTKTHLTTFRPSFYPVMLDDSLKSNENIAAIKETAKRNIYRRIKDQSVLDSNYKNYLQGFSRLQTHCNQSLTIRVSNISELEIKLDKLVSGLKK